MGDKYYPASIALEICKSAVTKVGTEPEQEQQVTNLLTALCLLDQHLQVVSQLGSQGLFAWVFV